MEGRERVQWETLPTRHHHQDPPVTSLPVPTTGQLPLDPSFPYSPVHYLYPCGASHGSVVVQGWSFPQHLPSVVPLQTELSPLILSLLKPPIHATNDEPKSGQAGISRLLLATKSSFSQRK